MIEAHEIKVVDSGVGYTIGEMPHDHPASVSDEHALFCLFDGVDNMLNFVAEKMPDPKNGDSSVNDGRDDFNAFDTYEQAMETFRYSPKEVVKFDPSEIRIKDESESGQRVDYDVVGDYIDMGRYMEGIPESWGSMHSGTARNRRINITINLSQWWGVEHGDITHRGERLLRLIDALEAGGVRTMLTGISDTECEHVEVILKRHDEPLTISDLAVVTHPEFLRRILFRIKEHSKTWDYGYGSAVGWSRLMEDPELLHSDNNDEMNIFVDSNMQGIEFIDQTFDKLEKLLIWEMNKPTPEVDAIRISERGLHFNSNGARDEGEVQREGLEAIKQD